MPKEVFIHEWKIQDYSGRRETTMKSEKTINGEHVYACKHLTEQPDTDELFVTLENYGL